MVKNLPPMQKTRVQSLGQGRSPGEGNGCPLQYSCLDNFRDRGVQQAIQYTGSQRLDTTEQVTLSLHFQTKYDFPSGTTVENPLANAEDAGGMGSIPGSGKIPRNGKQQATSVFLLGKFYGQRSLMDQSLWGCKESDTTERLSMHALTDYSINITFICTRKQKNLCKCFIMIFILLP